MSEQPKAVCGLAYDCVQRLSPIVRQIDFALDWTELEAGRALYKYVYMYIIHLCIHMYNTHVHVHNTFMYTHVHVHLCIHMYIYTCT